jgi:hypothetical protein
MRAIAIVGGAAVAAVAIYALVERRRRRLIAATATAKPVELVEEAISPARKPAIAPKVSKDDAATPKTEESASRVMQRVREDNKNIVRAWETREWEKAAARIKAAEARIKAQEAAGIKDPVKEYSKQLVAAREAGELTEQRVGQEAAEATVGGLDKTIAQVAPPKAAEAPVTLRIIPLSATAVTVELKLDFATAAEQQPAAAVGATSASIAAELRRWPRPPASSGCVGDVVEHCWPLYHDHYSWLDEVATTYSFADVGEVLRHLIFVANGEASQVKRLIFKVIRCLHCHSGTRAGHIPKRDKSCGIFDFQMVWLTAVHKQCDHPTVEKTVRVLIDYYRKVTSDKPGMEAELFWRKRTDITRGPQFEAYLPGVPGNYMLNADKVYNKRI